VKLPIHKGKSYKGLKVKTTKIMWRRNCTPKGIVEDKNHTISILRNQALSRLTTK
jgi:hypothetical protein